MTAEVEAKPTEPEVTLEPTPAEPDKAAESTATELPEAYEMGDSARETTRNIHKSTRELERLQKATEDRKAELADLDKQVESRTTPTEQVDDSLDPDNELRNELQAARREREAAAKDRQELRGDINSLRDADQIAERQEHEAGIESGLKSLVSEATTSMIPGLSEKGARRAQRAVWSEFQDRMEAHSEASGGDMSGLAEGTTLQDMISASTLAVREDYTDLGYQQLKTNRAAAAQQPVALDGTPAEPGTKDFKDMTPEEREAATDEMSKEVTKKAGLVFKRGVGH